MPVRVVKDDITQSLNDSAGRDRANKSFLVRAGVLASEKVRDEASSISATNALQQSIDYELFEEKVAVVGNNYAEQALETGTPPGSFPNITALKRWARTKGINEGLVFNIGLNI